MFSVKLHSLKQTESVRERGGEDEQKEENRVNPSDAEGILDGRKWFYYSALAFIVFVGS